jgi:predicted dehydrogenase
MPPSEPAPHLKARVGLIGCGYISDAYFRAARTFPVLEIVACSNLNPSAAEKAAQT